MSRYSLARRQLLRTMLIFENYKFIGDDKTSSAALQVPSEITARGDDQDLEVLEGF